MTLNQTTLLDTSREGDALACGYDRAEPSHRANRIKNDATLAELEAVARWIRDR